MTCVQQKKFTYLRLLENTHQLNAVEVQGAAATVVVVVVVVLVLVVAVDLLASPLSMKIITSFAHPQN